MQADDPPFLLVGTDVSAKYKGAFCEAKIKKVVRNIKCKVTFKEAGVRPAVVSDDAIKGAFRLGSTVEVKVDQRLLEATVTKIHDHSQYTVVFDDGDITTLRRTALCLKSGRHFAESETLDQLPLTHPEHFGNPVVCSSRRGRRTNRSQSDDSDSEASEWAVGSGSAGPSTVVPVAEREPHVGRVVLVQCSTNDKKRAHHQHQWFPGLVVAPNAQDTVKIKVKEDYLVRSFKDGRYYTVPKKEAREFKRNSTSSEWGGLDAALSYLDKGVLPPHWDKDILFGQETQSQSDDECSDDSTDDEPHEEKDHFVAQLYKFLDDSGNPLNRQPTIANKDIDLYRLFKLVHKLGGYNRVTSKNQWKKIAMRLGFHPASATVTNLCRQAYNKFLLSFEDFYRKLGVTLLSTPRGARTTGRSLIRDRDKMHSTPKSGSPAPPATPAEEKTVEANSKINSKAKEEKSVKVKEKDSKAKEETKEKETKNVKEKDVKDKENKEKETKMPDKEKDSKKDGKAKESKETKEKSKDNSKQKQKELKVKTEPLVSSEEDSADNQPLIPLSSIKIEKVDEPAPVEKPSEKVKANDTTPKTSKLIKSASAIIEGKKNEKGSLKKIAHRRNSLPRTLSSAKDLLKETRCKSSSSDSSTTHRKNVSDDKGKEKECSIVKKHVSSSDKNDSDSSSRGSKNGKTPMRRNATSRETTPSLSSSSGSQTPLSKKPRKRKLSEPSDTPNAQVISANIGDKLKVYYGSAHSEIYEAKVIEIDSSGPEKLLRVHYTGWNTRYDEWIKPSLIVTNITQHAKNKHDDKNKKKLSSTSPLKNLTSKKSRNPSSPMANKPHTRNRSGSNNTTASSTQPTTDASVQSESDSESESDSSIQKQQKKNTEEAKIGVITDDPVTTSSEKSNSAVKEKVAKQCKLIKNAPMKRLAENSQRNVKRTRLKQDENLSPRGRDYDLNEIRSELKGLDTAKKSPKESVKVDQASPLTPEEVKTVVKPEKTPDKVADDIYEFKEPEPFEFEARKSEEKKKRLTSHRLFDDIQPLKISPSSSPDKPALLEPEKSAPKSHFDSVFDKLCQPDNYKDTVVAKVSEGAETVPLFSDVTEDEGTEKLISEGDDSQPESFNYASPSSSETPSTKKPYIPIFKKFTPAKNQETYSRKDIIKVRNCETDLASSPVKGEQSSDEDPIRAAIQRVNAHPMSDDSNDGDLLIKTSVTPPVQSSLISTFVSDARETTLSKSIGTEIDAINKSKLEGLLKQKPDISIKPNTINKEQSILEKPIELKTVLPLTDANEATIDKSESDSDVALPEPPPSLLIHKEGPSIAEKVLRAINHAKRVSSSPPDVKEIVKASKTEPPKSFKPTSPKNLPMKMLSPDGHASDVIRNQINVNLEFGAIAQISDASKVDKKGVKKDTPITELAQKTEHCSIKPENIQLSSLKKDVNERRKSVPEPTLGGKSNKVLSETIQRLSSQISQPPTISIPEYQRDDHSESTDSDDSDNRLIIDKLSEEESQSCVNIYDGLSQPVKAQTDKANRNNVESRDVEKSLSVKDSINPVKESGSKQPEEDGNISLLLCQETIPGSPAPENLPESSKSSSKSKSGRNLEASFVASSSSEHQKESQSHKETSREKEPRDRECGLSGRNDNANKKNSIDTVMDNTPPTTPESSEGNVSPSRDRIQHSGSENREIKLCLDESRNPSRKNNELDKSNSNSSVRGSAPSSPGAGTRRGRRPRGCRLSDTEDQMNISSYSQSNRQTKYNFYIDLDPLLDGAARIALITSRLSELRKVYNSLKAELATIDRRRKKLRRKEREALKAAKAACS